VVNPATGEEELAVVGEGVFDWDLFFETEICKEAGGETFLNAHAVLTGAITVTKGY